MSVHHSDFRYGDFLPRMPVVKVKRIVKGIGDDRCKV